MLVVMLAVGYAAMFYSWNQQAVSLTAWHLGGNYWVQDDLPMGLVVLAAVVLGAIIMAICLAGAARQGQERLRQRAVAKLKQQQAKIAKLEAKLAAAEKATARQPALVPKLAPVVPVEEPQPEAKPAEPTLPGEDEDEEFI